MKTAEEWFDSCKNIEQYQIEFGDFLFYNEHRLMEAYAKYYHEQKLKELTDEIVITEVEKLHQEINFAKSVKADVGARNDILTYFEKGLKTTREWYLKNNT